MRKLLSGFIVLFPLFAFAGPFGLDSGQSLESLSKQMKLKKEREYIYSAVDVPRPHSDFERYTFIITPTHGLCKISALSRNIRSSAFGPALKTKFDELESALSDKYGKVDRNDFLQTGSIWKDSNDWMMSLYKEERVLTSYWTESLPENIKAIELEAAALSPSVGFIALRYEFSNASECLAHLRKKKSDPL